MCGIGVFVKKLNAERNEVSDAMEAINRVQKHRGPDTSGCYSEGNIGLCHTRLSIIDLSEKANQPFISDDGMLIIVYNGEVYNFGELRMELQNLGEQFRSESDTEVILKSYEVWGTSSFNRFNGMFALAILDKIHNKIIVARDRIGIKPLHYYMDNERIIFTSEIKAILKIVDNIQYRTQAINDILMCGHIEGPSTAFESISTLQPGTYGELRLSDFSFKEYKFFNLLSDINSKEYVSKRILPKSVLVDRLNSLIQDSVKMHLISDAPLGSLCSGGIDSSLITAIAKGVNPNLQIFHAGVENDGGEEVYAKKVAKHLNVDINYIAMNRKKYLNTLVDAIYHSDSPIYHPNDIPLYHICELARSQGVKVLLCGEGADELFGGYSWQIDFVKKIRLKQSKNSLITRALKRCKHWIFDHVVDYSDERIDDMKYTAGVFMPYGYSSNFMLIKNYSLIYNNGMNMRRWNSILDSFDFLDNLDEICGNAILLDNMLGHLSTILYRTDRMGMMASIENRVPFLENNLINFALNLPLDSKVCGNTGKRLLKSVAELYLPKDVVYRKKEGFPVPWSNYIQYSEKIFVDGFVANHFSIPAKLIKRITIGDAYILFRLLSIEIWGRIFVLHEDKNRIRELICLD